MGNSNNRKPRARLARRVAAWEATPGKDKLESDGLRMNKPGSQNRKK